MNDETKACKNEDRQLWQECDDKGHRSMHVTKEGAIGINVGGSVRVMPLSKWHELAENSERHTLKPKDEGGFVEGYRPCKCGYSSAYLNIHKVVCCGNCGAPLEILPPAPTDRQEALAEIAFRYGYGLSYYPGELAMSGKPHQYNIALTHGHGRHALHLVCGSTYAAVESAARLWLEKLADKEEGK